MTEQLVTLKTAQQAMAIGFPLQGDKLPTQAILQRWLREVKKVSVEVSAIDDWNSWLARVYGEDIMSPFFLMTVTDGVETYEEALEDGLLFAVNNVS